MREHPALEKQKVIRLVVRIVLAVWQGITDQAVKYYMDNLKVAMTF